MSPAAKQTLKDACQGHVRGSRWDERRDFPGGPVVKTAPSNAGGESSKPGWDAKIPHASWPKSKI